MAIFLFAACFGLGACKGRYDDMEFAVSYAFSENAENWYDGSNGIEIFHGTESDELQFGNSNFANIYLKIEVKNVKAKYIDDNWRRGYNPCRSCKPKSGFCS